MSPATPSTSAEQSTDGELELELHTYKAFKYQWYLWQFLGLKFPHDQRQRPMYAVYSVILNLVVTIGTPLTMIINCALSESLAEICENLFLTVSITLCSMKIFNVFRMSKKLQAVRHMTDQLDKRATSKEAVTILRECIRSAHMYFFVCCGLFVTALTLGICITYLSKERRLIFPAWFPLDWKNSMRHYMVVYLYQLIALTTQLFQNLGNDTYPQAYLGTLCAHIKVLSLNIESLGTKKGMSCEENFRQLTGCIKDHERLIELHQTMQEVLSVPGMMQLLGSGLCQCTIGVSMLYVNSDLVKMIFGMFFFAAVSVEILILCYFGEQLHTTNEKLTEAIYACNWMEQSPQFKQCLLLLLTRSQKPMVMMAGNLVPLQLVTFVQVMKTAYSTFAVLAELK